MATDNQTQDVSTQHNAGDMSHLSKNEKKARKAMEKLGYASVSGFSRVVFRRPKGMMLAVAEPQVFKSGDGLTFVVLGEAKTEDLNVQAQQAAAERLKQAETQGFNDLGKSESKAIEAPEDEEETDETGIDNKDIELVMSQASVSRARAVKALRENDLDIVNSIMALTT